MIDFKENIELLEKVIFNFLILEDDDDIVIKPKNYDGIDKKDLILMAKSYFFIDDTLQKSFKEIKKYVQAYHKFPTRNEIRDLLNLNNIYLSENEFDDLFAVNLKDYSYDFLYKYTKAFILIKNLNTSITETLTFLKTSEVKPENIDSIVNKVRDSLGEKLNLSFSKRGKGLNFSDPASHKQTLKSGTPSGFHFFDKVLGGGWNEKTLVVFQGRPKVGKTTVLSNIAARAYMSGVNVGVATTEVSREKYVKKIGANVLNIPVKTYETLVEDGHLDVIQNKLNQASKEMKLGELWVEEFPTGDTTAIDIENYFLNIEQSTGIKFKVIVVDYINLMRSLKDHSGSYGHIKAVSEELRAIAIRNNWCIITATQMKRESVENLNPGMTDVAESFGLIHTVDTLFGLVRPPLSKEMKINVIVNRDDGFEGSYRSFYIDYVYNRLNERLEAGTEFYSEEEDLSDLEAVLNEEYEKISRSTNFKEPVSKPAPVLQSYMKLEKPIQNEIPVSQHTGKKLKPLKDVLSASHASILSGDDDDSCPF